MCICFFIVDKGNKEKYIFTTNKNVRLNAIHIIQIKYFSFPFKSLIHLNRNFCKC